MNTPSAPELIKLGRYAEAEAMLLRIPPDSADYPGALIHLGMICSEQKQWDRSLAYMVQAREFASLRSLHHVISAHMGNCHTFMHRYQEAVECYEAAYRLSNDPS